MFFKCVRFLALRKYQICGAGNTYKTTLRSYRFVPPVSKWTSNTNTKQRTLLSENEVKRLEQLSLLEFKNVDHEKNILEDAIAFAAELNEVDTCNVEPMVTVLENHAQYLREDVITEKSDRKEILRNAQMTLEDYFVAPLGNVNLSEEKEKMKP